jgi:hypothetical protein
MIKPSDILKTGKSRPCVNLTGCFPCRTISNQRLENHLPLRLTPQPMCQSHAGQREMAQEITIRLRSAVGERKQWSADGETDGTESERNAAAEPQAEAPANADNQMQLVTRARLAKSEAQQSALWSRRLKVGSM